VLLVAKLDRLSRDVHFLLASRKLASSSLPAICRKPIDHGLAAVDEEPIIAAVALIAL
jgi:hypothetical protein